MSALFVITSTVDYKRINRLLLQLRDWQYGEAPTWDTFKLITTGILPEADTATIPPITDNDLATNVWANQTISDIESFVLNQENKQKCGLNLRTFLVLDEQGVKDGTIIVLDLPYSEDEGRMEKKFNKVRVRWESTYIMHCNLAIGNMGFEDFVQEQDGDEVEWWTYNDDADYSIPEEIKMKRQNAIIELEQKGMA